MIEQLRRNVVTDAMAIASVASNWEAWLRTIRKHMDVLTPQAVLGLGDHLSEIFLSTRGSGGRAQNSLASGGAAWEGLVCWYLNLCLVGSGGIVFKKRSDAPKCVLKALSVTYGNTATNSESDLIAVTVPQDRLESLDPQPSRSKRVEAMSKVSADSFESLAVAVIQCKTNWNDNAQIPMLWDIVYQAEKFKENRVVVGSDNYSLRNLHSFHYAFVTVPTLKRMPTPGAQQVNRVRSLSGGNYWGRPTTDGVARSAKEIFAGAAIGPQEGRGLYQSLRSVLTPAFPTQYDYFQL